MSKKPINNRKYGIGQKVNKVATTNSTMHNIKNTIICINYYEIMNKPKVN